LGRDPGSAKRATSGATSFAWGGGTYDDIVVTGREEPAAGPCKRALADAVAAAAGYEVVACSEQRAVLVKGQAAFLLDAPLSDEPADPARVRALVADLGKPAADRASYDLRGLDAVSFGLTYASIAAEFPAIYARAARREVEVADAGRYGGLVFLYAASVAMYLSVEEVRALESAGIALGAAIDAQAAAAAKDVDACLAKVKQAKVVCSKAKSVAEAAVRLYALIKRPDTHVVARIVDDPATSGAVLELYPAGATPPGDPNGTLPYALEIDGTALRAVRS